MKTPDVDVVTWWGWDFRQGWGSVSVELGNGADWDAVIKSLGYEKVASLGALGEDEFCGGIRVLRALSRSAGSVAQAWEYLLEVDFAFDWGETVLVRDLPSLLELLPRLAAAHGAFAVPEWLARWSRLIERAWRVWHGHDHDTACDECDPIAASAERQRRRELQERRAAREKGR